ncbi:FecR family protein [Bacteroides sp.]
MTEQDKIKTLDAISKAIDEDIENIIGGKEIDIPETEDTCFRKEQVYTDLMKRIQPKSKKFSWMKIAAVLLPFLVLNVAFWIYSGEDNREAVNKDIYVPCGEKMTVILSDGTKVYLNADTKLTYPELFVGKERKVAVEGEAYFEVKKDAKKPFIVDVASMQIKVLGTSFNVNAYPSDSKVMTTLDEGSVKIRNAQSNSFDYIMKPGETAIYEKETGTCIVQKNKDYKNESVWLKDVLIFNDTPLEDVLKVLSRKYNVKFNIENKAIYSYTYTLRSESESLQEILESMEQITPIKYKKTNRKEIKISPR